ncbi:MAG: hypothetical protein EBU59_13655, partial [Planctomycetia bacterium]|nr:hypothetical protein [Planctomycetia bacterium]
PRRQQGQPRKLYTPRHCPPGLESSTLAAVFNAAGYDTMRTCKTGNSYEAANRQFTVRPLITMCRLGVQTAPEKEPIW